MVNRRTLSNVGAAGQLSQGSLRQPALDLFGINQGGGFWPVQLAETLGKSIFISMLSFGPDRAFT